MRTNRHAHRDKHRCRHRHTHRDTHMRRQRHTHTDAHGHTNRNLDPILIPGDPTWGRDPKVEKPWVNSFPAQIAGPFCPGHNEPVHLIVQTQVSLITLIIALPARPCYIRGSQQQSLEGPVNEHNHFLSVIKVALCLRIVFVWSSGWPATSLKSLAFRTLVRCI